MLGCELHGIDRLVLSSRGANVYKIFSLWCMKICILGFYERLTARAKPYDRLIDISYLIFFVTFIGVILSTVLECRPFPVYCKFFFLVIAPLLAAPDC